MKLREKVVVVTGAGSGIGRELALQLLANGARVAGVDVNGASLSETRELARASEDRFAELVASVADKDAVSELPAKVLDRFGVVDAVINNAGIIQPFVRFKDLDYQTIDRVFRVNLYGPIFVTKAFLPHLLRRPEAHIVNLSSMGGFVPVPGQTIYCAAKAAVKLMSEGLASELIHTKVKVSIVCPGAVATNITQNSGVSGPAVEANGKSPMKVLSASKAASIILRGIESDAYHIFVGTDATVMDKLYRLAPAFAARMIAKKMASLLPA
jgi:NAD(P)-dependent dehydrogenase (short-subunit alcohol dehydrogenase family)